MWSIKVAVLGVIRVGIMIVGVKLFIIKFSTYSAVSLFTEHLLISILKSPAIKHGDFWADKLLRITSKESLKSLIFLFGWRYIPV